MKGGGTVESARPGGRSDLTPIPVRSPPHRQRLTPGSVPRCRTVPFLPSSASPHFSPGGMIMAQEFFPQRVLGSEERSGDYVRASMCALREKGQARARPAQSVPRRLQTKRRKMLKTSTFRHYAQRPGEKCGPSWLCTARPRQGQSRHQQDTISPWNLRIKSVWGVAVKAKESWTKPASPPQGGRDPAASCPPY